MYVSHLFSPSSLTELTFPIRSVQKMQSYARQHGLTEFISMQNRYNAIYREEEREMVPLLQDLGVGMIPYTVLASGFLTRKINEPQTGRSSVDQ